MEGLRLAQIGSIEIGLNPTIRIPGFPKLRNSVISSGVKVICSPPNLKAFLISTFSTTRELSSAISVVTPVAI